MYYAISKNGMLIGLMLINPYNENFNNVSFHEFDGAIPDLNTHTWDSETEQFVLSSFSDNVLTKLQFLNKFTVQERIEISNSTDPIVMDIMRMFNIAEYINLSDSKTIQAVQYLISVDLLTLQRYNEIIA